MPWIVTPCRPRLNRHLSHPYHCAGYEYEGTEVYFSSVVSSGDAPEMLELVETAFDPVALFVDFEVMVDGLFSCRRAGDDGRGSELSDAFSDGIAVMSFVGQDIFGSKARPSSRVPLARRRPGQLRGSRATVCHRYRWRDGSWLSVHLWNAPEPGSGAPFSGGRLLMGSHDRAVEHEVGTVAVLRQCFEDPLPYPRLGPTREALVNRLPLAMALRKVLPSGARAKHPQNTPDKKPVVSPRLARIAGLAQKQGLNPFPLLVAQLVSLAPSCHLQPRTSWRTRIHIISSV